MKRQDGPYIELTVKNDQKDGLKEGGKPSQTIIYLLDYILKKF